MSTAADLWTEVQRREDLWNRGEVDREATRRAYVAAGWTVCPHDDCPPWSCRH